MYHHSLMILVKVGDPASQPLPPAARSCLQLPEAVSQTSRLYSGAYHGCAVHFSAPLPSARVQNRHCWWNQFALLWTEYRQSTAGAGEGSCVISTH